MSGANASPAHEGVVDVGTANGSTSHEGVADLGGADVAGVGANPADGCPTEAWGAGARATTGWRSLALCGAVGIVVAAWAMVAIPAQATYGARTTADEPQYLLTALSLAEDRDLWIDDELRGLRYRPFHAVDLPLQTERLANGHDVSPHDPLLPVLLAAPTGVGGWAAAKATLAVLGGLLASALAWIAHRRLDVPLGVASVTVLAFGLAAPLSAYSTQVYPEIPAALAVTAGMGALLGSSGPPNRRELVVLLLAVSALPWLGVKYAPVAAALAAVGLFRLWRGSHRSDLIRSVAAVGAAGLVYLVAHRVLYDGWTVYAAGDHFVDGELTVMGTEPNYVGRSRRLVGLLLDREFGLAAWMPGYLLAVPAGVALLHRRPAGWAALVLPLAAGWVTATWVALTMHGWWWPGRQVVVVLPCVVLAVAWWAGRGSAWRTLGVALSGVLGAVSWLWVVVEVLQERRRLIIDFAGTRNPFYRGWHAVLPDYRHPDTGDWLLQAGWLVVLGLAALIAADRMPLRVLSRRRRRPTHVPA